MDIYKENRPTATRFTIYHLIVCFFLLYVECVLVGVCVGLPPTGVEPQAAVKGDARPCMAWKGEANTPAPPNLVGLTTQTFK